MISANGLYRLFADFSLFKTFINIKLS
jgi:hypothetical protein